MKINKKIALYSLIGVINASTVGCGVNNTNSKYVIDEVIKIESESFYTEGEIIAEEISSIEDTQEIIEEETIKPILQSVIIANIDTPIYNANNELVGILPEARNLPYKALIEPNMYEVDYYNETCYVLKENVTLGSVFLFSSNIEKIVYTTSELALRLIPELQTPEIANINIPIREVLEVYDEFEDEYLVKVDDYIGYVDKEALNDLIGTFVVIDISNQELKLYQDNAVILKTPVVTGAPGTPSDEGLFEIYHISHNRYLVGPGYRSYVDIMMKYNGGEGLHDAQYHTNDDGFSHGWRSISEFGGQTFLTDGSHGCINMLHDDVMEVADYVDIGTKVLVKK